MAGHEGQGGHNRSREKKDNGEDEIPLLARLRMVSEEL